VLADDVAEAGHELPEERLASALDSSTLGASALGDASAIALGAGRSEYIRRM
jgi:hypothetical protein